MLYYQSVGIEIPPSLLEVPAAESATDVDKGPHTAGLCRTHTPRLAHRD